MKLKCYSHESKKPPKFVNIIIQKEGKYFRYHNTSRKWYISIW